MVYEWMAWSWLLVLMVKCVSKIFLPGGGFILLLCKEYVIFHYNGGLYREYEDHSSDPEYHVKVSP